MILSYLNPLSNDQKRHKVNAHITTEHSMSSYRKPVFVLEDREALDGMFWRSCNYRGEKATEEEQGQLASMGLIATVTSDLL